MRIIWALMAIVLMLSPAYSQQALQDNSREQDAARALEKKRQTEEIDKQYQATIRAIGEPKASSAINDPWGGVREI